MVSNSIQNAIKSASEQEIAELAQGLMRNFSLGLEHEHGGLVTCTKDDVEVVLKSWAVNPAVQVKVGG